MIIEPLEHLRAVLRHEGYSLTAARKAVFAALQNKEAQSMHDLVLACRATDRASVYRCVALFEQLGIVQRLSMGWKYKLELSDRFHHHHRHLSCVVCGAVIVLPENASLERHIQKLAGSYNFTPKDHQVEIRGVCATCRHDF